MDLHNSVQKSSDIAFYKKNAPIVSKYQNTRRGWCQTDKIQGDSGGDMRSHAP